MIVNELLVWRRLQKEAGAHHIGPVMPTVERIPRVSVGPSEAESQPRTPHHNDRTVQPVRVTRQDDVAVLRHIVIRSRLAIQEPLQRDIVVRDHEVAIEPDDMIPLFTASVRVQIVLEQTELDRVLDRRRRALRLPAMRRLLGFPDVGDVEAVLVAVLLAVRLMRRASQLGQVRPVWDVIAVFIDRAVRRRDAAEYENL